MIKFSFVLVLTLFLSACSSNNASRPTAGRIIVSHGSYYDYPNYYPSYYRYNRFGVNRYAYRNPRYYSTSHSHKYKKHHRKHKRHYSKHNRKHGVKRVRHHKRYHVKSHIRSKN